MLKSGFDAQPSLNGASFALGPMVAQDFEGLAKAASDPLIWAVHPVNTRHRRDVFAPYFDTLLASKATLAIRDSTGVLCGCSRYYSAPDMPDTVSIGFTFLTRNHWGGSGNREIKTLMLDHAFRSENEVWFHIDPMNMRSQKATQKLGAIHKYDTTLNLGGADAPFKCYQLTQDNWHP